MNILKYILITISLSITNMVFADTITVTNNSNTGTGSLRQAIFDANAGDTINFAADYTIILNNELFIDKDLTIDGSKQNITISGNNSVRVFNIFFVTVNLSYLTITEGNGISGGAVMVDGATVTVENSTIFNNSAGDGGGISNFFGSLTINKSSFIGNSAFSIGGGIYSTGTLQITDSTFANNSASNSGGGLYDMSMSTAIFNSTFSGNNAFDGGGIYAMTSFPLMNTIIANSTGGDCFGISAGDNFNTLIEDGSCNPTISADPMLETLQYNGGLTQTFAVLSGSPAINAGDNSYCFSRLDQRGFNGKQNGNCDIGAYESVDICIIQSQIPQAECDTLVAIYDNTNGISWGGNWTITDTPCDDWGGISCNFNTPRKNVTGINRSGQGLTGELPNLSALTSLNTLDLNGNSLTGSFPNISALTNLQMFSAWGSQLTGSIPDLSNLSNLLFLNLNNNKLTGSIPNFHNNLTQLALSGNQLTGTIPDLSSLSLSNTLTDFDYNSLIGETGTSATDVDSDWADTQTIAPILSTPTILTDTEIKISWSPIAYTDDTGHYQVKYSTTSGGSYTDAISKTTDKSINNYTVIGLTTGTTYYFVVETFTEKHDDQQNDLTSILSSEVSATTSSICDTQSEIPKVQCETLVDLYNSTDGDNWTDNTGWTVTDTPCTSPNNWKGITCDSNSPRNVIAIKRVDNNLSGTLPDLSDLIKLERLELATNQLTGNVPSKLNTLANLSVISMGHNQFTGTIPDLSSLNNLQKLILSYNQLTGTIPTWLNNMSGLGYLSFADNQLTGTIPDLNNLNLTYLFLANNQLTGTIPTSISNFSNLKHLYLSKNKLEGTIPNLDNLTKLESFRVEFNQLSGIIPSLPATLSTTITKLGYNAFIDEEDSTVTDKDPDWADSQTVPPILSDPTVLSDTEIKINWQPIAYYMDDGHYQVKYATTKGGSYINASPKTTGKSASYYTVTGLTPATTYYFVVETFTPAHGLLQQNDITSILTEEIVQTTPSSNTCSSDITVINDNNSGSGSLRQAIVDLCAGGNITFDGNYNITLISHLVINKDMTINKTGKNIRLDGDNITRVFKINDGTVELNNLTIRNGYLINDDGAGILIEKDTVVLTINDSIFDNNIMEYITDEIHGGGGAINNIGGNLTVNNSTFSNNQAVNVNGRGGAIRCVQNCIMVINNSTFLGNNASKKGGALWISGASNSSENDITINNSTFYNNSSDIKGGAVSNMEGITTINNSTFSDNKITTSGAGAIYNGVNATLNLKNTIITNSTGDDCKNLGTISINTNNLIEDGSCSPTFSGNPLLSALANNNGSTKTMALQTGSPAIDAGDNSTCLITDQRNITRPQGAACDIGAYETLPICVTGNIAYVDKTATGNNDGSSWNDAFIELSSTLNPTYLENCTGITEIQVAQGIYTPGILRDDTFQLQSNLAIYGGYSNGGGTRNSDPATNNTMLSGEIGATGIADNSYHVVISKNTNNTAILDGFSISYGYAEGSTGGGILNLGGSPTLKNLIVSNNESGGFGGGIFTRSLCNPVLTNILIENNIAGSSGGGFASRASKPTLNNIIIRGNYAGLNGGGVNNTEGSNITMNNVVISGNEAFSRGGGISSKLSKATLTNVTITGNHAPVKAGGILSLATSASFVLNNVIIWGNTTNELGSESFVGNETGTNTVSYSIIEGSSAANWWTTNKITDSGNNIDLDPLFITPVSGIIPNNSGDLHLNSDSPAIDIGNNCLSTDLDGITRPQDGICDIGAYEFSTNPPTAPSDLIATVISDTQINLSWTDNSDNETGFKVGRDGSLINTVNLNNYTDNNVVCNTTYSYSVKATNTIGDSEVITATATTQDCIIEIPVLNSSIVYYKLTIEKIGNGIVITNYGINCGNKCEYNFTDQTEVSLTVTPDINWLFIGWTGDCDKNGLVRINKDKTCIANFASTIVNSVDNPQNNPDNLTNDDPTNNSTNTSNELATDGNGDGILDSEQLYVITIPDAITGDNITISNNCPIKIASAHTEAEQAFESEKYSFPQGIVYYELQCKTANITMYFHGMSKFRTKPVYKKFGPLTPGDFSTLTWYTLPNVIFTTTIINGKPVAIAKFTLKDGELGDNTGVDGKIVDPGGIGFEFLN